MSVVYFYSIFTYMKVNRIMGLSCSSIRPSIHFSVLMFASFNHQNYLWSDGSIRSVDSAVLIL